MISSKKTIKNVGPQRNQANYTSFESNRQLQSENIIFMEFEVFYQK